MIESTKWELIPVRVKIQVAEGFVGYFDEVMVEELNENII